MVQQFDHIRVKAGNSFYYVEYDTIERIGKTVKVKKDFINDIKKDIPAFISSYEYGKNDFSDYAVLFFEGIRKNNIM